MPSYSPCPSLISLCSESIIDCLLGDSSKPSCNSLLKNRRIFYPCLEFSKKLETYGVRNFAEEYLGTHGDKLAGWDGRIYNELLPFFDAYLVSEGKSGQGKVKEKGKVKKN